MQDLSTLTTDLAAQIKAARARALLSQRELAARLGCTERSLQAWEAGASFPQPRHRRALAAFIASIDGDEAAA